MCVACVYMKGMHHKRIIFLPFLSSPASIVRLLTEKALSIAEGIQVALPVVVVVVVICET